MSDQSEDTTFVDKLPVFFQDQIKNISDDAEIIKSIYYYVIMITGFMVVVFLGRPQYELGRSMLFLSVWLILVILLQPPPLAIMKSKPFEDVDVIK